ncbi:allophanate hydrolase [Pseudidiomarina aestuarii]|uniref:Allophanate hydrolase n=2 Tax=Pseudidiomarina aestuarii TaxID=624146 RepID=A0A6N4DFL7_9GAMM|nr:allophanate hydrolase [Pseudidiomarina aestuarii]
MSTRIQMSTAAENAVMLSLVDEQGNSPLSIDCNEQLHALAGWLLDQHHDCIVEVVPSYASLLIYYDAMNVDEATFVARIQPPSDWYQQDSQTTVSSGTEHSIQVCYDLAVAPDLERVAQHAGLTVDEVITQHQQPQYHVYALGFAPGFAYLGDVPTAIRCPRLKTPRQKVPALSVAIANQQTSVYPTESPGGWNLIGQVVALPQLKAGDKVRFVAIDLKTFNRLRQEVGHG